MAMSFSERELLLESHKHKQLRHKRGDPWLPSSPTFGIYRMEYNGRRHRWDPRDIAEYHANEHRERHELPRLNWRAKSSCR
jgi:hypothetical protein